MRLKDSTDTSTARQQATSFPECAATHARNTIRGNDVSLVKNFDVHKSCVYSVKWTVAFIETAIFTNSAATV